MKDDAVEMRIGKKILGESRMLVRQEVAAETLRERASSLALLIQSSIFLLFGLVRTLHYTESTKHRISGS